MAGRYYRAGTVEALIAWSKGTCYWPKCSAPIVLMVEQRPMMNLDVARIHALNPDGPRYDRSMTKAERNSFDNLLLLCRPHHRQVDVVAPLSYTSDMLKEWKRIAEPDTREELDFLVGMDEDKLQTALGEAITKYNMNVATALDELKALAERQGGTLQQIASKLDVAVMRPQYVNAEDVAVLDGAASQLSRVLFEDNVNNLLDAATKLAPLLDEDLISDLKFAADKALRLQAMRDGLPYE